MSNIKLLDCTLRDGGYINNWLFGEEEVIRIINSLYNANVDIIECGYLDSSATDNPHSTRFPSILSFEQLILKTKVAKDSNLFLMIDYNPNLTTEDIPHKRDTQGFLKGIRLAFHQRYYKEAISYTKELMDKGYEVCIQPMVTSSYADQTLLELVELSNQLNVYAFYMVDSFGTMSNEDVERLYHLINYNLTSNIKFGLHTHNNKQLAYSNSVKFLGIAKERKVMLDASVYGMGRGAGNLNTEIIADYLNKSYKKNYEINPLLQIIDNTLKVIKEEKNWGYSIEYFMSASKSCHPNYSSYLMNKKTLNVEGISEILDQIPVTDKGSFKKELVEDLYFKYISNAKNKGLFTFKSFLNKKLLLIASGTTVKDNELELNSYINNNKEELLILGLNHIPDISVDFYFFSNQKRYETCKDKLADSKNVILTSNITNSNANHIIIDNRSIFEAQEVRNDNVIAVVLQILINDGFKQVDVAGVDGFDLEKKNQYSYNESDRVLDKDELKRQNQLLESFLESIKEKLFVNFITPSRFNNIFKKRVLGVIPARYKSTRLPGKPLVEILGKPMIQRTYEQAKKSKALDDLIVATDDERIIEFCESVAIPVTKTSEDCLTGTDRVAEVAEKLDYDLYVNIQGDEPVIDPVAIDEVVKSYNYHGDEYLAYNLYKEIENEEEFMSNTCIKVLVNENNELLYMSRYPVPFNKSTEKVKANKQVCVYGFTKKALSIFAASTKTRNEKYEDIEILRFLDLNYKVKMMEVNYDSIAVDVPEDVKKVEEFLLRKDVKILN
ncbi:3-deoxy-manno-octulosonate cytidylyltransferase [Priestia megaterium]|uniref:3-deoxy-manno-octulosonate cytidylyltransferase n=1 Tax=Priestia megaterium TaxID=1404 RepID=UPI0011A149F9|nr:3-deoxy-manno-octulosonate cytidylyltransferase [Priestia megaterium]